MVKTSVFYYITPCSLVNCFRRFEGSSYLHLQDLRSSKRVYALKKYLAACVIQENAVVFPYMYICAGLNTEEKE